MTVPLFLSFFFLSINYSRLNQFFAFIITHCTFPLIALPLRPDLLYCCRYLMTNYGFTVILVSSLPSSLLSRSDFLFSPEPRLLISQLLVFSPIEERSA